MSAETATAGKADTAAKKEIRKGPKIVGRTVLILFAAAAAVIGSLWGIDAVGYVGTDDAAIDGRQIKVSSRMLARISGISAVEGQRVSEGDVLVTLDATDLNAQKAQAEASLAYARQNARLAKVNLDKTREDFERVEGLFKNAAATRESFEHAQNSLDASIAQFDLAQAQIDTANAQLGVITAQLANATLRSSISGTVDKISLVNGDVVQPGQAILSVNDLGNVWVVANLEETKIGKVAVGARVRITVDAYKGRVFEGKVSLIRSGIIAPAFQIGEFTKTTQRIPVRIDFAELPEDVTLLPGMSVEVKVRTTNPLPSFLDR
jgi:membrane fusion protein, multidrug efflux system